MNITASTRPLRVALLAALVAVLGVGCGADAGDGTGDAVIIGQLQGGLHRGDAPRLHLNGHPRAVEIEDDADFVVRDVPTGDVTVEFETDEASGTVTVAGVEAGEVIEIVVSTDDDGRLHIRVARRGHRDVPRVPPDETLHYRTKDAIHQLRPGTYHGDLIIDAKDVTVIGARDAYCDGDNVTVLEGDLIIRGKDAQVVDVIVLGRTIVTGKDARIVDTCAHYDPPGPPHDRHGDH
ncbi:MAG: hypothetical protein H6704_29350 [Myxococcales bacterium]|nr:hypothetical protein [Myxococcales bacterium]